jgi:hypothetical protein
VIIVKFRRRTSNPFDPEATKLAEAWAKFVAECLKCFTPLADRLANIWRRIGGPHA